MGLFLCLIYSNMLKTLSNRHTQVYKFKMGSGYNFASFEQFKGNKKEAFASNFINGTPKRIRIAVYTVKGCCPRPLDDGGLSTKSIVPNQSVLSSAVFDTEYYCICFDALKLYFQK